MGDDDNIDDDDDDDDDNNDTFSTVTMGIVDPLQPASGVFIKYSGGNSCPLTLNHISSATPFSAPTVDTSRYCGKSLRINFHCSNEITEIPNEVCFVSLSIFTNLIYCPLLFRCIHTCFYFLLFFLHTLTMNTFNSLVFIYLSYNH